jgi:hypothetical protein
MLFFKNVKLMFWVDVVLCIVYLRNIIPSHSLGKKSREMWYDYIPSVGNLGVFGSIYYALIPKEQRNNLGARSQKCIFLGYSNSTKEDCVHNDVNKKFILSKYVIFLESTKNAILLNDNLIILIDLPM